MAWKTCKWVPETSELSISSVRLTTTVAFYLWQPETLLLSWDDPQWLGEAFPCPG